MGVRFEGKEGRSYNNPSIHPAVFERGAPRPGGRGILIGLLNRLSWVPETQRSSGSTAGSGSDGRVFTLSLHLSPAAHWRKLISATFPHVGPFGHHPNTTVHRPKPPVYLLLHPSSSPLWTRTPASGTVVIFMIFLIVINNTISKLLNYVSRQSTC